MCGTVKLNPKCSSTMNKGKNPHNTQPESGSHLKKRPEAPTSTQNKKPSPEEIGRFRDARSE